MGRVPPPHTNLRRVPVQRRSAERLARILDAGAGLLDEAGYEQLSTRAVADRAQVPIGSVYRFFPNKRALVDALAERNLELYAERITGRLADIPAREWGAAIDAVLDEYLAMKRTVPGFTLVDFGPPAPLVDSPDEANRRVAGRLATLLADHLGHVSGGRGGGTAGPATGAGGEPGPLPVPDGGAGGGPAATDDAGLLRTVLVCVVAADALLQLAFRTDPSGDPGLIAQTRLVVRSYLAQVLG
ncbi:TetR/AcrR family transcriptional regulator [Streptomyces nitrosporeus]|uniref:TetR/AcrR family transcriptional regulator n=1 Tax=Streptomyces nitrosporeus TaxID=28894 RepID=UPI00331E2193